MDKREVKDQIIAIIREASSEYITADEIFIRLTEHVDPGRTQETIRQTIRELVNEDDNLIGSTSKGYFNINSEPKLEEAVSYLLNRIPFLEQRAENLRKAWNEQRRNK